MPLLRALWNNQKVKKVIGFLLILVGLVAFFTPFTPGSWLVFVGLELIGIRMLFWDKIKLWFRKHDSREKNKIKRIIFITVIVLIVVALLLPLAAGY